MKVRKVYDEYVSFLENESNLDSISYNTFRLWANGFAIAPSNKEYLKSLGAFFEDEYLLEHYEEMDFEPNRLRTINRNMGRRLSKLIKNVIFNTNFIDYDILSFEERNIYNLIKNSIYQVI